MALASLNLAASSLSALAAKLAPASLSTLIPAKLAAIPVVAGLVVGTAAGASFVTGPSYDAAAKAPQLGGLGARRHAGSRDASHRRAGSGGTSMRDADLAVSRQQVHGRPRTGKARAARQHAAPG